MSIFFQNIPCNGIIRDKKLVLSISEQEYKNFQSHSQKLKLHKWFVIRKIFLIYDGESLHPNCHKETFVLKTALSSASSSSSHLHKSVNNKRKKEHNYFVVNWAYIYLVDLNENENGVYPYNMQNTATKFEVTLVFIFAHNSVHFLHQLEQSPITNIA